MRNMTSLLAITLMACIAGSLGRVILIPCPAWADSQQSRKSQERHETVIPSDVSYTVIESSKIPGIKRSLDVRLNKKITEDVLRAIANELKMRDRHSYERTFIAYYLPGMDVGAGAWATTHYTPLLEVQILGMTIGEDKALSDTEAPVAKEILGRWQDERPYVASQITMYREGNNIFIERIFKDGSSLNTELTEIPSPLGRRFNDLRDSAYGAHWVIETNGNLQMRDNEGLIATIRCIK